MTKAHILAEIRRTADANGGKPLGTARFYSETGIKETDWAGKHWARWGDALREAGFEANTLNQPYESSFLLDNYARLALELGRLPVRGELKMRARSDGKFPSWNTFSRFGSKRQLAAALAEHCRERPALAEVVRMCEPEVKSAESAGSRLKAVSTGHVYLLKSGGFYKIGRTNDMGRRGSELRVELPEASVVVHQIATDDPAGIEAYWHNRFRPFRANGEWFKLAPADVAAFRRRRFM